MTREEPPPLPWENEAVKASPPTWAGIWLVVLPVASAIGFFWIRFKLPMPHCPLHTVTGLPCPSCGMTRGLGAFFQGDWQTAWMWNPLGIVLPFLVVGFWLYCLAIQLRWAEPLRVEVKSPCLRWILRTGLAVGLFGFWIFLILRFPK